MDFSTWLKTAWTNLLSWFGVEEQKLASFLYPVFQNTKTLIKNDFLTDVIALVPAVESVLTGGYAVALAEAGTLLTPLLAKQGAQLGETDIAIIQNALVAQAQASAAATAKSSASGSSQSGTAAPVAGA